MSQLQYTPLLFREGSDTTCRPGRGARAVRSERWGTSKQLVALKQFNALNPQHHRFLIRQTPNTITMRPHLRQAAASLCLGHIALGDKLLEGREQGAEQANVVAEQAGLRDAACRGGQRARGGVSLTMGGSRERLGLSAHA